jgi:predicted Zn-dependent peptidase
LNNSNDILFNKPKITKKTNSSDDIVSKLKDLKELLESGVLTDEEFEKAKKKLLN